MPAKNIVKQYVENGYYHIYNRGVEKREIFPDEQDYKVFLYFLKRYLTPPSKTPYEVQPLRRLDLYEKIQLIAYCLMPNHFHLLIRQFTKDAIIDFMRAIANSYVRFFNTKYQRRGPLFEGNYKAVLVENEPQLLHLSRYIHLNPNVSLLEVGPPGGPTSSGSNLADLAEYPYSSYGEYLGKRKTEWIHPEEILAFFKTAQKTSLKDCLSYQSFVEECTQDSREILGPLTLERGR